MRDRSDAERNRGTLLEAAADVLARSPGASMAQVTQAAGLARATLYRHFGSRHELLAAMPNPDCAPQGRLHRETGSHRRAVRTDIPPALVAAHIARTFEAAMRDWAEGLAADVASHLTLLLDLAFQGVDAARSPSDQHGRNVH